MKIIIGGPPHSGKSCLRYGLKEAIKNISADIYPHIITACPDGEGSWFQETMGQNSELGNVLKSSYKSRFSPKLVRLYSTWVRNCNHPLTFIDIGGLPDAYNEQICETATHAILLYREIEQLNEWRSFCSKIDLKIIAELKSALHAEQDECLSQNSDGRFKGAIHRLQRGDMTLPQRPAIQQLASLILEMSPQTD